MKKFIEDNKEDLANDRSVYNLGSQSIQKGEASYCSSCSTVSPSIVSIFLREGWTISGAKEHYLKYENGGDKFVSQL